MQVPVSACEIIVLKCKIAEDYVNHYNEKYGDVRICHISWTETSSSNDDDFSLVFSTINLLILLVMSFLYIC